MEEFELMRPTKEYAEQIAQYRQEFLERNDSMNGCGPLRRIENIEEYIQVCRDWECADKVPAHLVKCTQFIFVRKSDNRLVGMIQVRHGLNDFTAKYAGHIGYSVRPSERCRGYAAKMLEMALGFCREIGLDKVLLTCDEDNAASEKVIAANGGVFECAIYCEQENMWVKRFWIGA